MKKTFLILGMALLVVFTGCSLFENLIPTESSVTFTLGGTSYSDDQTTINRAFAATQFADSTVATARVLDATSGNGMLITTIFTGGDGTYTVTSGLDDLSLALDRMTIQIWEGDFNSDSSNVWDASNVTLTVTNFVPNEDNSLVSFEATFSGSMVNEDTEETAQVTNGTLVVSAIGN
ncbi:MAG: hypothetical protein AAFQ98_02395 [Bacteroidota bacterium]